MITEINNGNIILIKFEPLKSVLARHSHGILTALLHQAQDRHTAILHPCDRHTVPILDLAEQCCGNAMRMPYLLIYVLELLQRLSNADFYSKFDFSQCLVSLKF